MPALLAAVLALATPSPVRDGAWAASLGPGLAHLPAGRYRGPWRLGAGVQLVADRGAVLEGGNPVLAVAGDGVGIRGLTVRATGVGLAARGVRGLSLLETTILGGTRAIYLAEATAQISGGALTGAEYGLLTWQAEVTAEHVAVTGPGRAGFGLVRSTAAVIACSFEGPFSEAAVTVIGAPRIELRGNRVRRAGAIGLKLVTSTGQLEGNDVRGARADPAGLEGDDVYLFDSTVDARGDSLGDADGSGLAVLGGSATFAGCRVSDIREAAFYVGETGALELLDCAVERAGAGLVVERGASGRARATRFQHIGQADGGTARPPCPEGL